MRNQIQKIFTSKKIILSILGVFVIGLLCCLSIIKSEDKRDNLLTEIVKYQIQQSTQKTMKNFDVTYFSDEYAPNCPIYVPFIYYSLNPKVEFLGVDERQGTTLYTFSDNRYLNFGYYDPSVMGKDEAIEPIFNDHNDQSPKTPQEIAKLISTKYCMPINAALEKYKKLPIPEIVKNMRRDIWGTEIAKNVEDIEEMLNFMKKTAGTDDLALVTFREGYKKNCLAGYMVPQRFNMLKNHVRNYTAYTDCVCSIADEFSTEDMNFIIQNGEDVFMQTPRGANLFKQTLEKCEGL